MSLLEVVAKKRSTSPRVALLFAAGLLTSMSLGACDCGGAPDGVVDQCQSELALPPSVATDILFVIDNSGSMREEQQKVVDELHTFVETLVSSPIRNDFQIGVVTTGVSQNFAGCGENQPPQCIQYPEESGLLQRGKTLGGQVIDPSDVTVLSSSTPDVLALAQRLVGQGIGGAGQEMGLEAARRAITEPLSSSGNAGFLRPGARLLVVILSDEDDCSDARGCEDPASRLFIQGACGNTCQDDSECGGAAGSYCLYERPTDPSRGRRCTVNACESAEGRARLEPVETYVQLLQNLDDGTGTGRRREVFLAVIGAVDASASPARCRSEVTEAYGVAVRYKAAVDQMGQNGLIESICNESYAASLAKIAALVNAPQTVDLARAPPDPRLLFFEIVRGTAEPLRCRQGEGFEYEPPVGGAPARVTFKDSCRLQPGDQLSLKVVCAG
ncbi:MAG: VWA domain-containing protein [Deltaproteobacteria bacterium]|nr:VWA domain-containing protein [Deltaproteobacteria bacterium]